MKLYGTLEYKKGKAKYESETREYWAIKGFFVNQILQRVITDTHNDNDPDTILVENNVYNIDMIKWIMQRFPLEIKNIKKWNEAIKDLGKIEERKEQILSLKPVTPNSSTFIGQLREFQKIGLDFLQKTSGNALLADDMGLGKTVETLAFIATENSYPVLVVCPLSVLYHWQNEIKKFVRIIDTNSVVSDQPIEPTSLIIRSGKQSTLPQSNFYIINYELLNKRKEDIKLLGIKTIVFDEVQNLRRMESKKYQASIELAKEPSVKHRFGLSGTPIYNRAFEIWGIVNTLKHGILGSYKEFTETYCSYSFDKGMYTVKEGASKALAEVLKENVMIRRRKEDVLSELPEKTRFQQYVDIDQDYYKKEVEAMLAKLDSEIHAINIDLESKHKAFEIQAAYDRAIKNERQIAAIAKMSKVVEYIKDLMEIDKKVVVFCHHLVVHDILMQKLSEFFPRQIVGGQKPEYRQKEIEDFQNKKDYNLMIAGLRAGSLGINLNAASYIIFAELDWTPAIHRQAEDRLHRMGQKNAVFCHYLIGKGTLDEYLVEVLMTKADEIDATLGDKKDTYNPTKAQEMMTHLQKLVMQKKHR